MMEKLEEKRLSNLPLREDWTFADKTTKDTGYITHSYYTYPAKFIPQLAARLIQEHSKENEIVIDPFMGSGTTIVEAIVNKRKGIGTDINEIAVLLAKVKTTPINYGLLLNEYSNLMFQLKSVLGGDYSRELLQAEEYISLPERVDFWFKPHIKDKLRIILYYILQISHSDIRDFFLIAFAQILKTCSIWAQKSVKPTRDLKKKETEPLYKLDWQVKRMLKKHKEFNEILPEEIRENIDKYRIVANQDARNIPCPTGKASLIVTSPPYVTSYEYADLHQLPSLWFGFLKELSSFRKKFIGSSYREREKIDLQSVLATTIVQQLKNKKAREVENYFADMLESFLEMKRVLRQGGKAIIVIGNTKLKGVEILNAEVFKEQMENIGFKTYDIIHRRIPSKMLPSIRDPKTGKFTKSNNTRKTLVYPTEFILIMEEI